MILVLKNSILVFLFIHIISSLANYDVIINLGGDCQVAWQMHIHGIRNYALPFDKLITPFNALYKVLENRFANFLNPENLEFRQEPSKYIVDTLYDIRLIHDFTFTKDFLAQYEAIKLVYDRRIKRFLTLMIESNHILFIRKIITQEETVLLYQLLCTLYPEKNFDLLVVDGTEEIKKCWQLNPYH